MNSKQIDASLRSRVAHLQRVVNKEYQHLRYSADGLVKIDPEFRWLDAVEQNPELAEKLDAFASRFCRLQYTLGDKLLPVYLRMQLEPVSTALDNLNRAEKLGLIPSVEDWIEARNLRNYLVHEYTEDAKLLRQSIKRAIELLAMLEAAVEILCKNRAIDIKHLPF